MSFPLGSTTDQVIRCNLPEGAAGDGVRLEAGIPWTIVEGVDLGAGVWEFELPGREGGLVFAHCCTGRMSLSEPQGYQSRCGEAVALAGFSHGAREPMPLPEVGLCPGLAAALVGLAIAVYWSARR